METHPVNLTGLSPAQMSRLRNGHACRCSMGSKGEGISAFLGEDNIKKLMKAGRKGAKATISLAKHELEKNRMEGSGLVSGGRHHHHHHHGLKKLGHALKKVGKSPVVQALKKEAINEGSAMAKTALQDAGIPPSVANKMVNAGSKKLDKSTGGLIEGGRHHHHHHGFKHLGKQILHSKPVQDLKRKGIEKGRKMLEERAQEELEKRGVPSGVARTIAKQGSKAGAKQLDKSTGGLIEGGRHHHHHHGLKHFGKQILHSKPVQDLKRKGIEKGRKMLEERAQEELEKRGVPSGVARTIAKQGSKAGAKKLDKSTGGGFGSSGGAIGMSRRVESVGAGGNLLHRHPSQMSQADSANFHFSTQFPPGLAEVRGSGLYGSGLYV